MKDDPVTEEMIFTALAFGGNAVARSSSGKVCFVPGVIPGERALIRITEEKKNYSCGELVSLMSVSPQRVETSCPAACPGCPCGMMEYPLELQWKNRQLEEFVRRLKKMEVKEILPAKGSPFRRYWRNKISLHLSNGRLCYVGRDNKSMVPVKECPIASQEINQALQEGIWKKYIGNMTEGKVTFRSSASDGVCIYTQKKDTEKILTENLGSYGLFRVEKRSFFQINTFMAPVLAEHFLDTVRPLKVKRMVELYCGCGVFSVLAAEKLQIPCSGIELDEKAVLLAEENARNHSVEQNCRFYAGDAGKVMKKLYGKKSLPSGTLLLVDPPRTGLEGNAVSSLLFSEADWIVYISCNPSTLMRDLEILSEKYTAEKTGLLDMFPSTAHFETLTLLKHR